MRIVAALYYALSLAFFVGLVIVIPVSTDLVLEERIYFSIIGAFLSALMFVIASQFLGEENV